MNSYFENIVNRLQQTNRKKNFIVSINGALKFLFLAAIAVIILSLLEAVFNFGSVVRTVFISVLLLAALLILIKYILIPLFKNLSPFSNFDLDETAKQVGEKYPEVKDELLNAVQLIENKSHDYSSDLIEAAFQKVYEKTKQLKFTDTVSFTNFNLLKLSSASLVVVILVLLSVPFLNEAFSRVLNYDKEFIEPPKYVLEVEPGNIDITKGEDVKVIVKSTTDLPPSLNLMTKSVEQAAYESTELQPDSIGEFTLSLKSLNSSTRYYAEVEDVKTQVFEINVIDRPIVRKFELKITPPAYTNLQTQLQVDNGSASVLPGTRLKFNIAATKQLKEAHLQMHGRDTIALAVNQNSAAGNLIVKNEFNYSIGLKDTNSVENERPITYSINLTEDRYPIIDIVKPGENIELGLENILPLTIDIADDYGFSSLELNYQINTGTKSRDTKTEPITFSSSNKEQQVFYSWDIAKLNLKAEDVVSYFVVIGDNDNINGPKKTKSKIYTIRVPSLNELFANADQKQNDAEVELTKTLEEAKKLGEEMQRINNELKKDQRQITFEEKEKVQKAMEKFKELGEKVEDIKQKLDDVRKDLADNNLLSEETLQKYNELQELMDQFSSEEMKKAFEKMQEQLNNLMRNQVQEQMENMQFNEEMFKKSLERTVNLLKRIQIEQKMDEVIKRTEELSEQLDELQKETEQSDLSEQSEKNELAQKQESLNEQIENLEKEMDDLSERMSEFDDMPNQEAQELSQEMKDQQNAELNKEASEQIQQSQKQMAMNSQQQMKKNMDSNMQKMQTMQSNMRMQSQMKVMSDMMKSLDDLLTLSKDEEELKNDTKQRSQSSSSMRENAQKQNQIKNNLNKLTQRLSELSQKTFGITPEMGKALGDARREMNQSINSMQNNNSGAASQQQERAMKSMNEAAMLMKNALQQMMSGQGSGGGMMSMMQQLQQMSQQQMQLNQMTQMMNQGKLSQQQMAQMKRLAQQQQMIQKSLAQLNEEAKSTGQSKKLSANLEEILREMEEVVTNMQTERVDDDLVQKQEHILSKLLDAQRSINERDYEKERESFAGEDFRRETPPDLMLSTEEGLQKLRDELLNASKEGYKKDYEDLIRRYFEALQKEQSKN